MWGSQVVELASVPTGKSSVARSVRGFAEFGVISWWPLRAREAEGWSLVAATSANFLFLELVESLIRNTSAQWLGSFCQDSVRSCVQVGMLVVVVTMASLGEMRMQLSQRWLIRWAPTGEVISNM